VGIKDVPPNISLVESDSDRYGKRFSVFVIVELLPVFSLSCVTLFFFVFFINLIKLLQLFKLLHFVSSVQNIFTSMIKKENIT
jgi:hypothetical protein